MRARRSVVGLVMIASVLLVAGAVVGAEGAPTATPATESNESTHTLVITTANGSGSYTISASNSLNLEGEQPMYSLPEGGIRDTVGQQGNQKDVINYTGRIESFQAEGPVQVSIDGQQIPPQILGGQHIRIIRNNSDQPIRYQIPVSGQASPGESVEQEDTVTNGQIRGEVGDQADAFYFTGDIPKDALSISENATILINGQNADVFLSNPPPTPPETSPMSASPSSTTVADTTTPSPPTAQSPTEANPPTNAGDTSDGTEGVDLLDQVVRTVVVLFLLALVGMGAVLYLRR